MKKPIDEELSSDLEIVSGTGKEQEGERNEGEKKKNAGAATVRDVTVGTSSCRDLRICICKKIHFDESRTEEKKSSRVTTNKQHNTHTPDAGRDGKRKKPKPAEGGD